ncbi:MAG: GGDEF domain-containing protein [Pontibacterium sp.]
MPLRLITLLAPAFILLASAGLLIDYVATLPATYLFTLNQLPYMLALVVLLLAYRFNRNQILFATLNLTCAYLLIRQGLQTSIDEPETYVLFSAISLLIPVNITLIATYQERGLFTLLGMARLTGVLAGYLVLGWLWSGNQLGLLLTSLPVNMLEMFFEGRFLSDMAAIFYAAALVTTLLFFVARRGHGDAGVLASLLSSLFIIIWFDQPNISALLVSAALIAMGIAVVQNSHNMAYLDELTEIPARRALQDKLATIGRRYSIAMVDIDHFKKFNDTYGHDTGDQVLKMVAARLASVGGGGTAYRYGGEEFTLVFPGKDEAQVLAHAEHIREVIASYPMRIRSPKRPDNSKKRRHLRKKDTKSDVATITVSIGISQKTEQHPDAAAVIKQADLALYEAKRKGRNQSVTAHLSNKKAKKRRALKDYARS